MMIPKQWLGLQISFDPTVSLFFDVHLHFLALGDLHKIKQSHILIVMNCLISITNRKSSN